MAFATDGSDGVSTGSSATGTYSKGTNGADTYYKFTGSGTFTADVMDIFDTAVTTGAAQMSWTDFPVRDYLNYPLGIETTTGTFISVRSDPQTRVRVRYYRSYVPTTE